ncbi:hypothetical protein SAMN05660903_01034 [Salegentibacter salinarum]|nr:hypothetical protein SAMN05660903_01034 [Salegentibacter salinarum]
MNTQKISVWRLPKILRPNFHESLIMEISGSGVYFYKKIYNSNVFSKVGNRH